MSSVSKGHRDFSDIDNLDRATQSFMKEQHRQLSGIKAVRAPRNRTEFQLKLIKCTKIGALAAVVMLIVGVAVFAGIQFGSRNAGLIKPEQSNSSAAETKETETTARETEATEQTDAATPTETEAATTAKTKATTTATTAPRTDEIQETSAVTPASSVTTSETVRQTSAVTTSAVSAGASSQHASTSAPHTTLPPSRTTTKTAATATTSKTTTTTKTTAKATTTTTAAKANIVVQSVEVGDAESYNGTSSSQILTITIKNTGNAALTDVKRIQITCAGSESVTHASVISGSTSGALTYSGEVIYVPYSGKLATGATDVIAVRVIANEVFWFCRY